MLICIGKILKPFKQDGEVAVLPYTPDSSRFEILKEVLLKKDKISLVRNIKYVKLYDKKIILRFESVNNRDDAITLSGMEIMIREEEKIKVPDGSFFIDEIMGLEVFFIDNIVGTVDGFLNETSENPIIRIKTDDDYFHVPFQKGFIEEVCDDKIILTTECEELVGL